MIRRVILASEDDFEGWRTAARALAASRCPPDQISWQAGEVATELFACDLPLESRQQDFTVPRSFIELARAVICHSHPERFALLYTMLVRLGYQPGAMDDRADPLLRKLETLARTVRRDMHKMRAFVRFREIVDGEAPRFIAWFEPDHHIMRANAGFFVRRFSTMCWSILTPAISIHWDGQILKEGFGASRSDAPGGDPLEDIWRTYYASIFNPARVKINAMLKEMPRKYWHNMPETRLVSTLIAGAQERERTMVAQSQAKMAGA